MITIDGSQGEGGGQILRSLLALSMVTGQPFRIEGIRANRSKPGLMRQHLTCVEAARAVCGGQAEGTELGSRDLAFTPGPIRGGSYDFAIGTAGSTTLVLQTVLPALVIAPEPSSLVISGGTHNTHAPSVYFLQHAFVPIVQRMGPVVHVELERHGFYPAGGGRIRVLIEPSPELRLVEINEAGPVVARRATATVAGLSESIGRRELSVVRERLGWTSEEVRNEVLDDSTGPGNILSIEVVRDHVTEVFTGFGERGVSAETVAKRAAGDVQRYLRADVPVWTHLADQLMLPMALARGGGFRTGPLTDHSLTNAAVIEQFLDLRVHHEQSGDGAVNIRILA